MASFSRAQNARPNGLVPGSRRADTLAAIETIHLKPSELQTLFHCSRSIAGKLTARPDFPAPVDLTGDGKNLRYALDEILLWRNNHRREVRMLKQPPRSARPIAPPPSPSAEAAVRAGLAALRGETGKKDPTGFR